MAIITLERARPSNDNKQKTMMTTMMTMFLLMATKAKLNEHWKNNDDHKHEDDGLSSMTMFFADDNKGEVKWALEK